MKVDSNIKWESEWERSASYWDDKKGVEQEPEHDMKEVRKSAGGVEDSSADW